MLSGLRKRLTPRALGFCALALSQLALAAETPGERVRAVRIWPAPEYTRVTLESGEPLRHHLITIKDPERLVLDLEGGVRTDAAWGWAWTALGVGAVLGPIATLRLRALRESAQMAGGKR